MINYLNQATRRLATFLLPVVIAVATISTPISAATGSASVCQGAGGTWNGTECVFPSETSDIGTIIGRITNLIMFLVGAVSVIMIIFAGFKYVTSGGDQAAVTSAKNTIIYAVVGIIVAFVGYAVVNFVLVRVVQ